MLCPDRWNEHEINELWLVALLTSEQLLFCNISLLVLSVARMLNLINLKNSSDADVDCDMFSAAYIHNKNSFQYHGWSLLKFGS